MMTAPRILAVTGASCPTSTSGTATMLSAGSQTSARGVRGELVTAGAASALEIWSSVTTIGLRSRASTLGEDTGRHVCVADYKDPHCSDSAHRQIWTGWRASDVALGAAAGSHSARSQQLGRPRDRLLPRCGRKD